MKNNFIKNFLLCGLSGWCMECLWTGIDSIRKKENKQLLCQTSVWMFPIYGLAACFLPLCNSLKNKCAFFRGITYTVFIFITEFITGSLLKRAKACPWDYSKAKLNIKGVIRLDYAPAWFFAGLFFERLLTYKK